MGSAYVEIDAEVLDKIKAAPFARQAIVVGATDNGDGTFLAYIRSDLIAHDSPMMQELIVDGEQLKFKGWRDT
jgi:hypothetical protein